MSLHRISSFFDNKRIHVYLLAYCLTWAAVRALVEVNLDGYGDMLENYAWGQVFDLGTFKHPPLIAWVTHAWFSVLPRQDGYYYLLSYLNVALGLLGVYCFAVSWGLRREALPAILLLAMALPYSTLASKYNANSVLLPLWPWVACVWLKSMEDSTRLRGALWSVALGLLAALAMLGKYYSGVFLLGLFLVALTMPAGRRWLMTFRPWLALLTFGLCLLPHLWWLSRHAYITFHYVEQQGDGKAGWSGIKTFILAPLYYWGLSWLACCISVAGKGERWRGLPARLGRSWHPNGLGDSLFWLAMAPWLITLAFGVSGFVELSLPWAIPIGFAFPLLWLRNLAAIPQDDVERGHALIAKAFSGLLLLVVLLSPLYAWWKAEQSNRSYYLPRRELASALLAEWHARYPHQKLQWVGGQWSENAALAFYGDPGIRVIPGIPDTGWARFVPDSHWRAQPGLLLCGLGYLSARENAMTAAANSECVVQGQQWLRQNGRNSELIELTVNRTGWRFPRRVDFKYVALVYLP